MDAKLPWTDERVSKLRSLWRQGISASIIAIVMGGGVTRSAVIGKIHRLGIVRAHQAPQPRVRKRRHRPAQPHRPRRVAARPAARGLPPEPFVPAPAPDVSRVASILDLDAHHCRWICSGGGYCGAKAQPGASWCEAHAAVVFDVAPRRPIRRNAPADTPPMAAQTA